MDFNSYKLKIYTYLVNEILKIAYFFFQKQSAIPNTNPTMSKITVKAM